MMFKKSIVYFLCIYLISCSSTIQNSKKTLESKEKEVITLSHGDKIRVSYKIMNEHKSWIRGTFISYQSDTLNFIPEANYSGNTLRLPKSKIILLEVNISKDRNTKSLATLFGLGGMLIGVLIGGQHGGTYFFDGILIGGLIGGLSGLLFGGLIEIYVKDKMWKEIELPPENEVNSPIEKNEERINLGIL